MDLFFRYAWIGLVVVSFVSARAWWMGVQSRIQARPDLEPGYRRLLRGYLFWMNLPWLAMGLGILSGQVPTFKEFLSLSEGNAFVFAWWGLLVAMLCLGTYWIFLGGGAEMLERHPGVGMVPHWPAPKLRGFWLGLVAWNVALGSVLLFGLPFDEIQVPPGPWIWGFLLVLFAAFLPFAGFLMSVLGGWNVLAERYEAKSSFSGKRFHFRSAELSGYIGYGGFLTLGSGPEGLYLAVLPLFRLGHPPLIIPWSDLRAREVRTWWSSTIVELRLAEAPGPPIRLTRRLAQALFEASGTQVPVTPAT